MKKFKELDKRPVAEVESSILEAWGSVNDILNKTIDNRDQNENFVFYDGPATANGHPGLHHMLAKFLKDSNNGFGLETHMILEHMKTIAV